MKTPMRKPLSLVLVLSSVAILASSTWLESPAPPAKGKNAGGDAAALYTKYCAKCHLEDGKGLESLSPPNFTDAKWQAARTNAALAKSIREGNETKTRCQPRRSTRWSDTFEGSSRRSRRNRLAAEPKRDWRAYERKTRTLPLFFLFYYGGRFSS